MLRKKQIGSPKGKLNKIFPVLILSASFVLAGFGSKQADAKQVTMSAWQMSMVSVSYQGGDEAVLSAFRQDETGQDQTEENTENTSGAEETLQEEKTVSGNTISESETVLEPELEEVFWQVNRARREVGLTDLVWSDELAGAADIRAKEISTSFSHTRPNGSEWWSVNEDIVYGENLARGYQSADGVMKAWLDSAEHKDNILYSGFQSIGIAVYKVDGKWYWVQEFGF